MSIDRRYNFYTYRFVMRYFIVLLMLTSCSTTYYPKDFDNRVNQVLFQHNVRDCRLQPQCSVDQLFDRW